jgi:predicted protein tyrosine phosphatase
MKVLVLNKSDFDTAMKAHGINNDNVEKYNNFFFISIINTNTDDIPHFENKNNVKVLYFDDVDKDTATEKKFSEKQAKELIDFIEINKNKNTCIVHCAAGMSRSGAVGTFINDYYGGDYNEFKTNNPQVISNVSVLRTLKHVYYEIE